MEYNSAMTRAGIFFGLFNNSLIARTSASFSLDCLCLSPRWVLPFEAASCIFSSWVPGVRWLGLTQAGLSQRCKRYIPLGILPFSLSHENLCAAHLTTVPGVLARNAPYPLAFSDPCHSMQPDSTGFSLLSNWQSTLQKWWEHQVGWKSSPQNLQALRGYVGAFLGIHSIWRESF